MNISTIPQLCKGVENCMKRPSFFKRHKTRNILNQNGSRLKLINESKIFPK